MKKLNITAKFSELSKEFDQNSSQISEKFARILSFGQKILEFWVFWAWVLVFFTLSFWANVQKKACPNPRRNSITVGNKENVKNTFQVRVLSTPVVQAASHYPGVNRWDCRSCCHKLDPICINQQVSLHNKDCNSMIDIFYAICVWNVFIWPSKLIWKP